MITPAFAQGAAAASDPTGGLMSFAPIILIFIVMYFFMLRPQQKKAKEHREMLNAVRRGDVVVTSGGVVAKVTKVVEGQSDIEVEIADGVKVKLVRGMIADVRTRSEPLNTKEPPAPKGKAKGKATPAEKANDNAPEIPGADEKSKE